MILSKITWLDINSGDRWMTADEAEAWGLDAFTQDFVTIGYVIFENADLVVIGATHDVTGKTFHDVSMIPRSVIKSIEPIPLNV